MGKTQERAARVMADTDLLADLNKVRKVRADVEQVIPLSVIDLIRKINQNLLLMSRRMEEVKSMGSTLTLLFVEDHEFFVLNVGDSRTYWFDRDRKFVTTDHT